MSRKTRLNYRPFPILTSVHCFIFSSDKIWLLSIFGWIFSNQEFFIAKRIKLVNWQWSTPTQYLSTFCYFYISTLFYIFSGKVWLLSIFGARFIIAIILHGHYSLMDLIKFLSWQYCTARQEQRRVISVREFSVTGLQILAWILDFLVFVFKLRRHKATADCRQGSLAKPH